MSSIPGYTLDSFIKWNFNITVTDTDDANFSVAVAEVYNDKVIRRPNLTQDQFLVIMDIYSPYKESIEERLADFDEENQSWRSYAEFVDIDVPESVNNRVSDYLTKLKVNYQT